MILYFPLWPPVELWPSESLMTVDEIENFSPKIEAELDDDATLEDSLSIPGGLAIFCHRQREAERAKLVAANTTKKRSDEHESS